ncbi:MAG: CDC27 family protein [Anaeroplasma sp.]
MNPAEMFEKGTKMMIDNAFVEGIELIKKAGENNYDPANSLLADLAYSNCGDCESALKYLHKIQNKNAKDLYLLGRIYFDLKEYDKAISHFISSDNKLYEKTYAYLKTYYLFKKDYKKYLYLVEESMKNDINYDLYIKSKYIMEDSSKYPKIEFKLKMSDLDKCFLAEDIVCSDNEIIFFESDETVLVESEKLSKYRNIKMLVYNTTILPLSIASNNNIEGLFIKEKVRNIYNYSYNGLKYISVSINNNYFCSIDNVLFTKDKKELLAYPTEKIDEVYYIPKEVKKVFKFAFLSVKNLKKLYIHHGLSIIIPLINKNIEIIYVD